MKVAHRIPSALAVCPRMIEGFPCEMPLQLWITQSPLAGWPELVVLRCPWHIIAATGAGADEPQVSDDRL